MIFKYFHIIDLNCFYEIKFLPYLIVKFKKNILRSTTLNYDSLDDVMLTFIHYPVIIIFCNSTIDSSRLLKCADSIYDNDEFGLESTLFCEILCTNLHLILEEDGQYWIGI